MGLKRRLKFLVLFYPDRSPSQVYRLEAFLKYLPEKTYTYDWIINATDENAYYGGRLAAKALLLGKMTMRRFVQLLRLPYRTVILNREAFPLGTVFFEWFSKRILRRRLIFDFDDAIWLSPVSDSNRRYGFLKSQNKFARIMKMSDVVIAGNNFLAAYARRFNANVHVIPSCIDLDLNVVKEKTCLAGEKICIGWSGSESTLPHLLLLTSVMQSLQNKYGEQIYFKVISNRADVSIPGVALKSVKWRKAGEADELREFDIGIMPLPRDEWSLGKCSMKGIQYMGLAIPAVLSPVGMNNEVIMHNENGMLAGSDDEWLTYLSALIDDPALRNSLGAAGRRTVERQYSTQVWKNKWLELMLNT